MSSYAEHHADETDCGHPNPTHVATGEFDHYFCCCEDVGLCGADISDAGPLGRREFPMCPECEAAQKNPKPCGVIGCQYGPAYEPKPEDVQLVNRAWKDATCHHYQGAVCVSCSSVAILRALVNRYELLARPR